MSAKVEPAKIKRTEADYLYDKTVQCPACSKKIIVRAVRSSRLRLVSRDTDSMAIYQDINPLLYDVWLCNHCGYANLQSNFAKPLSKSQLELLKKNVSTKWHPRQYADSIYSEDTALERFKLALYNAMIKQAPSSELAMICLKTAWIYRTMEDQDNEFRYLVQACKEFEKAYMEEDTLSFGMDPGTHKYLIGELYRRTADYGKALKWFGEVLVSPTVKQSLKDKTRDQKDLTLAMMNRLGTGG